MRSLSALEARVLGVLVEKQHTVPDTYPMSLNALVGGCNQKTARSPVMEASDADVLEALDGLKALSLVFEGSGSRVVKFEHNMGRVLGVPSQAVALLTVLLLRGPQTVAELRLNSDRLHRFADASSVEGFLDELAGKQPPLVLKLARAPGEREARWAQLLCGPVAQPTQQQPAPQAAQRADMPSAERAPADSSINLAALQASNEQLTAEVCALRRRVERMERELGLG